MIYFLKWMLIDEQTGHTVLLNNSLRICPDVRYNLARAPYKVIRGHNTHYTGCTDLNTPWLAIQTDGHYQSLLKLDSNPVNSESSSLSFYPEFPFFSDEKSDRYYEVRLGTLNTNTDTVKVNYCRNL